VKKNYYNRNIGVNGYSDEAVKAMWDEGLRQIKPKAWEESFRHVEDEIKKWWEREIIFDQVAPLVMHLDADDSSSDNFSDLSSDE
jgi:hypothetical protein